MHTPDVKNVALLGDEAHEAEIIAPNAIQQGQTSGRWATCGQAVRQREVPVVFSNGGVLPLWDSFTCTKASRRDPRFAPRRSPEKSLSLPLVDGTSEFAYFGRRRAGGRLSQRPSERRPTENEPTCNGRSWRQINV